METTNYVLVSHLPSFQREETLKNSMNKLKYKY